jgi:phosphoribosyl 1,2-cyclic phosphodiesterase
VSYPFPSAPTLRVQSLGSGSSGNSFLVEYAGQTLLVDCGIGVRTVQRALRERGKTLGDIDAILLTHEHSDHVGHLSRIAVGSVPIVSTEGTRRGARLHSPLWQRVIEGKPVTFGEFVVWALKVSHDAIEPCGYLIESPQGRVAILTDLGQWHPSLLDPLVHSDLIILESNHDEQMLRHGPYPMHLKKRVLSSTGHLSNADHALAMVDVARGHRHRPDVWLAHLSETNNTPVIAERTVVDALHRADFDLPILALPRRDLGPVWTSARGTVEAPWHRYPPLPETTRAPETSIGQLGLDLGL